MLIQFADPPTSIDKFPYAYLWAAGAVLYPLCLRRTNERGGFWTGLVTVLLISVLAQAVEVAVYLIRTGGYRYGDTDTVVWAGFYLIGPLTIATIWYPLGYLASRLFVNRKPSNGALLRLA